MKETSLKIKKNKNIKKIAIICFLLFFCFFSANKVLASNPLMDILESEDKIEGYNSEIQKLEAGIRKLEAEEATGKAIDIGQVTSLKTQIEGIKAQIGKEEKQIKQAERKLWWDRMIQSLKEAGSAALGSAINTTLKQMAFDTATYLGSGGEGQKPFFYKEGHSQYWKNVADTAGGNFIEALGREGIFGKKFNLCEPDFDLKISIALGLHQYLRPKQPACTWTEMKNSWTDEYQKLRDLRRPDFLQKFQNMFDPTSNDLGIALGVQLAYLEYQTGQLNAWTKDREEGEGWLDFRGISDWRESYPGYEKMEAGYIFSSLSNAWQFTGSALIDAANVFANQYLITLIKTELRKLAQDKSVITSPYKGDFGGLTDYEFGVTGSAKQAADNLRKIVEPDFKVRGDYDILAELTICPDPNKAGPTNCVIDDKFRQAVANRLTVGQAMKDGYLNQNGVFGFINSEMEPKYQDGAYPYRSMKILRKFRIIPVGWEVAAQYIKEKSSEVGSCSLGDMVACYNPNDEYNKDVYGSGKCDIGHWCEGLVNPGWVLKAPQNYCAREGYGPETLSTSVNMGEFSVARKDNYCADEQSCIKESDGGACEKYGYCVEERGRWDFGSKSCDSKFNTCQTFRLRDGRTVSYLENTLDYCNESGVGCASYCVDYDFGTKNWKCVYNSPDLQKIYLNRNAETCDQNNEGCHEFIRTKAGLGVNLVKNSDFAKNDIWEYDFTTPSWAGIEDHPDASVSKALKIYNSDPNQTSFAFQVIEGIVSSEEISISYSWKSDIPYDSTAQSGPYVRAIALDSADRPLRDPLSGEQYMLRSIPRDDFEGADYWRQMDFTIVVPPNTAKIKIEPRVENAVGDAWFDNIKVEKGGTATRYTDYRVNGLTYLKVLPDYLAYFCYENGELKAGAPAKCGNFVRKCTRDEVGCELYTSVTDDTQIPGKASANDVCDSVCVGYDTYIAKPTPYDNPTPEPAYFIPRTARTCPAIAVGCEEFTNLDKLGAGAEAREYYSQLRNCIKPSAQCAEFYTWEGDHETGFQIRVHQLKYQTILGQIEPVGSQDSCSSTIYELPPSDPNYNPDCREFINRAGQKLYYLYSSVIECTENCHPYRLSNTYGTMDQNKCANDLGGQWLNEACVFMAIPEKSVKCTIQQVGCREYNGNQGNDMRIIFAEDFEGENLWTGGNISQESVVSGEKSYRIPNSASLEVGYAVREGLSYVLGFIAKGSDGASINAYFENQGGALAHFSSATISGSDWRYYRINLERLDHEISEDEKIIISGSAQFYIDNIRLTEIRNRYYLVKNSWNTPAVCDEDIYGKFSLYHDLGCDHYRDRDNIDYYFHNFSELCPESAAGCELMIDTHNYSDYKDETWTKGSATVSVPADSLAYVIYNPAKSCSDTDKGCQFLGKMYDYERYIHFTDTYLKNDPDKYGASLCWADQVGCESWQHDGGPSYFKDPQLRTCEWRSVNGNFGWYKQNVKRCEGNPSDNLCFRDSDCNKRCGGLYSGSICSSDSDCVLNETCKEVNGVCQEIASNALCQVSVHKTIGMGGYGKRVFQPIEKSDGLQWAGICPAGAAGCTEYIDPISHFSNNVLFNPSFRDIDGDGVPGDGWNGDEQEIKVEPFTLYVLSASGGDKQASITCPADSIKIFNLNTNRLDPNFSASINNYPNNPNNSVMFYTGDISRCTVSGGVNGKTIFLRKASVDYQLKQEVNRTDCHGTVDNNIGCVLFNERTINSGNYANLDKNAALTKTGDSPEVNPVHDSNALLKVDPDRVCNKWLACEGYVKNAQGENICYSIGLCDSFDENNNCDNPLVKSSEPVNYTYGSGTISEGDFANLSGYSKVGHSVANFDISLDKLPYDLYNFGDMKQVGESVFVPNANFEFKGDNSYPISWVFEDSDTPWLIEGRERYETIVDDSATTTTVSTEIHTDKIRHWNPNVMRVVDSANKIDRLGICFQKDSRDNCVKYAPEGKRFLALGAPYSAKSELADVMVGTKHYISFFLNTFNMPLGQAKVTVLGDIGGREGVLWEKNFPARKGWVYNVGRFDINYGSQIRIKLEAITEAGRSPSGEMYFDDFQIKPVLEVSNYPPPVDNKWHVSQSCRLYPQEDSLSCDYFDNSGIRQRGQLGYCLDYDRAPGDPNACILWYPIDNVKGTGVEEGAGYRGKFPVYYCLDADMNYELVEERKRVQIYFDEKKTRLPIVNFLTGNWSALVKQIKHNPLAAIGPLAVAIAPIAGVTLALGAIPAVNTLATIGIASAIGVGGLSAGAIIGTTFDILTGDLFIKESLPGSVETSDYNVKKEYGICEGAGCGHCPFGYEVGFEKWRKKRKNDIGLPSYIHRVSMYCLPSGRDFVVEKNDAKWYRYNGDLQKIAKDNETKRATKDVSLDTASHDEKSKGIHVYFYNTGELMEVSEAYERNLLMPCSKLVRVVGETGQNKAWLGRAQNDSPYQLEFKIQDNRKYPNGTGLFEKQLDSEYIRIGYNTPSAPFGSVSSAIFPQYNPYEWDGMTDQDGRQPITLGYFGTAGFTAGCWGEGCKYLGACSESPTNCLASDFPAWVTSNDYHVLAGNEVSEDSFKPRYIYPFVGLGCPRGEFCVPLEKTGIDGSKENIQQIFAKSYGVWEWKGGSSCTYEYGTESITYNRECYADNDCELDKYRRCIIGGSKPGIPDPNILTEGQYGGFCSDVNDCKGQLGGFCPFEDEECHGYCLSDIDDVNKIACNNKKEGDLCEVKKKYHKDHPGYNEDDPYDDNKVDGICVKVYRNIHPHSLYYNELYCLDMCLPEVTITEYDHHEYGHDPIYPETAPDYYKDDAKDPDDNIIHQCQCSRYKPSVYTVFYGESNNFVVGSLQEVDTRGSGACPGICSFAHCSGADGDNICKAEERCFDEQRRCIGGLNDGKFCTTTSSRNSCENPLGCSSTTYARLGGNLISNYTQRCNPSDATNRYTPANFEGFEWDSPDTLCPGGVRPDRTSCAILPQVPAVHINGQANGDIEIAKNGFVNLTFSSRVDPDQLPLVMYSVDWRGEEKTNVSGVEMRDRPDINNDPHSLYHLYSYWGLKSAFNQGKEGITCNNAGVAPCLSGKACCYVTPRVVIKDNWDWCSNGNSKHACNNYTPYSGRVVVTEY